MILEDRSNSLPSHSRVLPDAGWHFSYLGNDEHVANKIRSYSHHAEANVPRIMNRLNVENLIANLCGVDPDTDHQWEVVPIDESFPVALRTSPGRYQHLIVECP